ncbi:hypothetical protein [Nocardia sp. NPDC127526]|uniref:hypothetical protein n=1 Tax=Nocardia sp. NPDC127526 TaxID=3345393 RepID=UPI00363CE596
MVYSTEGESRWRGFAALWFVMGAVGFLVAAAVSVLLYDVQSYRRIPLEFWVSPIVVWALAGGVAWASGWVARRLDRSPYWGIGAGFAVFLPGEYLCAVAVANYLWY